MLVRSCSLSGGVFYESLARSAAFIRGEIWYVLYVSMKTSLGHGALLRKFRSKVMQYHFQAFSNYLWSTTKISKVMLGYSCSSEFKPVDRC